MLPASVASIEQLEALLARQLYIADRGLATSIYLALTLQRPLLLEGEAGVGKTEVAKVLASGFGTNLIRLQCYEGPRQSATPSTSGTTRASFSKSG